MGHLKGRLEIKLTLDVPALEKLIAGDDELHVHLQKAVVAEVAKKHLTFLLNETTQARINDFRHEIKYQVEAAVRDITGKWPLHGGATFELNGTFLGQLRAAARTEIQNLIKESVSKAISEIKAEDWVVTYVRQVIDKKLETITEQEIRARVADKIYAAFKAVE